MKLYSLFIICIFSLNIYADNYSEFSKHLKKQEYVKACISGKNIFSNNERDEKTLSLIGQVCLKADYIDTAATLQSRLRGTKEARVNAVIFSSIVLQKRLIYQFMYDNTDISSLALPISEHPLSHTFIAIRDKKFKLLRSSPKMIEFDVYQEHYLVYIDKVDRGRVVIEITDVNNKKTVHRYL